MGHKHPVNQAMHDNASRSQRAVDSFVACFGSLKFIGWMTVVIIAWLAVNGLWLTKGIRWDPYPFILLNLAFSAQATYAAPLILLSQNRGAERDRLKAEHDYQVNETALAEIKADRELTRTVHGLTAEVHRLIVQAALTPDDALAGVRAELQAVRALVTPTGPMPAAGGQAAGLTTQMAAIDRAMAALAAVVAEAVQVAQVPGAPEAANPRPRQRGERM